MNLDKALRIVDDKCDVELPRLKAQIHKAIQLKYGEQATRGRLEDNRTVAIIRELL